MAMYCRFALMLLVVSAPLGAAAQTPSGSFSFPGSAGGPANAGIYNPGFPDTSSTRPNIEITTPPADPAGELRSAYPVLPARFGDERVTNSSSIVVAQQKTLFFVFKDQAAKSTSRYWLNGQMLHYVDSSNNSHMVPVKRVDWKLTEAVNDLKRGTLMSFLQKRQ